MLNGCINTTLAVWLLMITNSVMAQTQLQETTSQTASSQLKKVQLTPQQMAATAQAQQQALASPTRQPPGFPLDPEHQKYVNDLLDFWEQNSKRVEKYRCGFVRYEYDSESVNWRDPRTNQLAAHKITQGQIRFAAPDRARYETTNVLQFSRPPQIPNGDAEYKQANDAMSQERWICDGKSLFDFDFSTKRLYETKIPPNMQGNISESPLPFIFGAEKKVIQERYWVRSATPEGVQDEYWLELYPKRIQDARNYSKIEIVIARKDFLPSAMHLYSANYDPARGDETSRYFQFQEREVNNQLFKLQDFFGAFVRPSVPLGWKRVDTQVEASPRQADSTNGALNK
jgi:TIGR03009 family protein